MVMSEQSSSSGRQRGRGCDPGQSRAPHTGSFTFIYSIALAHAAQAVTGHCKKSPKQVHLVRPPCMLRDIMRRAGVVAFDAKSPLSAVSCYCELLLARRRLGSPTSSALPNTGGRALRGNIEHGPSIVLKISICCQLQSILYHLAVLVCPLRRHVNLNVHISTTTLISLSIPGCRRRRDAAISSPQLRRRGRWTESGPCPATAASRSHWDASPCTSTLAALQRGQTQVRCGSRSTGLTCRSPVLAPEPYPMSTSWYHSLGASMLLTDVAIA